MSNKATTRSKIVIDKDGDVKTQCPIWEARVNDITTHMKQHPQKGKRRKPADAKHTITTLSGLDQKEAARRDKLTKKNIMVKI